MSMSMYSVVERYKRVQRRRPLFVCLMIAGIVFALISVVMAIQGSRLFMLPIMGAIGAFVVRFSFIFDLTHDKLNVPDEVLCMIAEEPTLPRRFKEELAKRLAVEGTLTFEELADLDFHCYREETKSRAREGEGFQKLAVFSKSV